jgi:hypothetical protein
MGDLQSIMGLCMELSRMEREWQSIVGPVLGRKSYPVSYDDEVLVVAVDGQAVLHDMNFRKSAIMREIRTKVSVKVRDIRLQTGNLRRRGINTPQAARSAPMRRRAPDESVVDAICECLLREHSDLDPRLVRIIARCRAASGNLPMVFGENS